LQNNYYAFNFKKTFFKFSSESKLWKHIKIGLADSLKNKKFLEESLPEDEFVKYSHSLTMKDRNFVLNFDFPTFFKILNKKKKIFKKKISYFSFYDLEEKKKFKKKSLLKEEVDIFKINFHNIFCYYENEEFYFIDWEEVDMFFEDLVLIENFELNPEIEKIIEPMLSEKLKLEKKKLVNGVKRTRNCIDFEDDLFIIPDFNLSEYGQLEPIEEFLHEDEDFILSDFKFDYNDYVVKELFHKSLDSLENFICAPAEPLFGFNVDYLEDKPEVLKVKLGIKFVWLRFQVALIPEISKPKIKPATRYLLPKKKIFLKNLKKQLFSKSALLINRLNKLNILTKAAMLSKNFIGANFFFLLLLSLKEYTFFITDTTVVETEEEYLKRIKKLLPYETLSVEDSILEDYCELDKVYHHPMYPLPVQMDIINFHYADKFLKKEPVRYFIKDSFKAKKNKELRANFKKNNKDLFFKKTYINKFNSYFFKKGNSLNTLKFLISGISSFINESLDRNIDEKFKTKNILAFFNLLSSSENNINLNMILAWILDFSGFIYFFKTKAVPKFLKKKIKKKYIVEPFFVKKEIRNKYTLKYFHFFTEKEQAFNLNDRFFDLLSSTAYDHKESMFFNYKVISLNKAIHKFLKNK